MGRSSKPWENEACLCRQSACTLKNEERRKRLMHVGWSTHVHPGVGLRQEDSVSPVLFRWRPEDVHSELKPKWGRQGYGQVVDGDRLALLLWADDMTRGVSPATAMTSKQWWQICEKRLREGQGSSGTFRNARGRQCAGVKSEQASDGGGPPELVGYGTSASRSVPSHNGHLVQCYGGKKLECAELV